MPVCLRLTRACTAHVQVHLYVTLLNLGESNGGDGSIVIRHKKEKPAGKGREWEKQSAGLLGAEGDEGAASGAVGSDDFEARLALRLQAKEEADAAQPDTVRYGESGWKERYYQHKLHITKADEAMKRYVVQCYVQGLCWVLMYYYQGVQDWGWFYPFHYAPCATDLVNLHEFAGGQFDYGAPFTPFQQLMAVFPPSSGHALPESYRTLMVSACFIT